MRRKLPVLLGAGLLVVAVPSLAEAAPTSTDRFEKVQTSEGRLPEKFSPRSLNGDQTVKVMVQLADDPVAVVESRTKLTKAQKDQLKASLKAKQAPVVKATSAKGGRVEAQVQSAYNGVKVAVRQRDVAALAALPGVKAVREVQTQTINNAVSVPFLGAPQAWESTGKTGKGVKVAIIDTGVDYTHADFGGPGTVAAYNAAKATGTQSADPALFGPSAPRVKGGIDLVGDAYNASVANSVPQPDPNPLDCQGHGSHVAGTAAGGGVTAEGRSYAGPYDSSAATKKWKVGPGVAPEADIYAVRVFGCAGSTDVTTEAIDWAVANDMDVINMSLGSTYGRQDDPSAEAASNAAAAGVVVVSAAGNEGGNPYLVGSPSTGQGTISVAAIDSTASFPGAKLTVAGQTINAVNANGATLPATPFNIVVIKDDPATAEDESLGCSAGAYTKSGVLADTAAPAQVAVVVRGNCARVAKAVFGQKAGADAVIMVNSTADLPPYEGEITENPDTGEAYQVTIPFLGVTGVLGAAPTQDGDLLVANNGQALTMAPSELANPGFRKAASFSSGGPTNGSSSLRPGVSAPGVSTASAAVGSGNDFSIKSGTSMATPHVAGVAALAVQAHPTWSGQDITNAMVSTSDAAALNDYRVTREGNGLVDIKQLLATSVFASGDTWRANGQQFTEPSLSFGFAEIDKGYVATKKVTLTNKGTSERTFNLSAKASPQSRKASVQISPSAVKVKPGSSVTVNVKVTVQATDVGLSTASDGGQWKFNEVSGQVIATSGGDTLAVPYLLVPRAQAAVSAEAKKGISPTSGAVVSLRNKGAVAGAADFYTLGLTDKAGDGDAYFGGVDLRAVGVQSFPEGDDALLVFAINSHTRFSNAATLQYEVQLDTNGDGKADKVVISADSGMIRADSPNGLAEVFVYDVATKALGSAGFYTGAPTDSSTVLLPVNASDLGITRANGGFGYTAMVSSIEDSTVSDEFDGVAKYNPWAKVIPDGDYAELAAKGSASVTLTYNRANAAATPVAGAMVVAHDNRAGADEALLIPLGRK